MMELISSLITQFIFGLNYFLFINMRNIKARSDYF